ncbi:uncharacterized protein [Hetaerina americana]|uniref:uncharacterized protein isoform X2 n=1 Tax=Hetaerina americana TaxID=62018 RepID=UPI003A7F33F5
MLINRLHMERCAASEKDLLLCELQKSYQKLLLKYAEAENTIDRMKLGFAHEFEPLQHDVAELPLKAIGYGNNCGTEETDLGKVDHKISLLAHESSSVIITKNDIGTNAKPAPFLDLFSNEEMISSIDSISTSSISQKSLKLADVPLDASGRDIWKPMHFNEDLLKEDNGDIFQIIENQNGVLVKGRGESEDIPQTVRPSFTDVTETTYNLKPIKNTSHGNSHIEGTVHLKELHSADGFKPQNGRRTLSNLEITETDSSNKLIGALSPKLALSDLCFESIYGRDETILMTNNHQIGENPSNYRYALLWPIHFETKDDETPADGSQFETCSEPSEMLSSKGSDTLSSLESTSSRTLAEDVMAEDTVKVNHQLLPPRFS